MKKTTNSALRLLRPSAFWRVAHPNEQIAMPPCRVFQVAAWASALDVGSPLPSFLGQPFQSQLLDSTMDLPSKILGRMIL